MYSRSCTTAAAGMSGDMSGDPLFGASMRLRRREGVTPDDVNSVDVAQQPIPISIFFYLQI